MLTEQNKNIQLERTALESYIDDSNVFVEINGEVRCKFCCFSISKIDVNTKKKLQQHSHSVKHKERVQICCESREMFDRGEYYSTNFMKSFIEFLNSTRLSFNALNEPSVKNFFRMIGFSLYSGDFYRKTVLPNIFEIEKQRINYEIFTKPFCISFEESALPYLNDVMAIDVGLINPKKI